MAHLLHSSNLRHINDINNNNNNNNFLRLTPKTSQGHRRLRLHMCFMLWDTPLLQRSPPRLNSKRSVIKQRHLLMDTEYNGSNILTNCISGYFCAVITIYSVTVAHRRFTEQDEGKDVGSSGGIIFVVLPVPSAVISTELMISCTSDSRRRCTTKVVWTRRQRICWSSAHSPVIVIQIEPFEGCSRVTIRRAGEGFASPTGNWPDLNIPWTIWNSNKYQRTYRQLIGLLRQYVHILLEHKHNMTNLHINTLHNVLRKIPASVRVCYS